MNSIESHPVSKLLADSVHDLFPVNLDDKELEKVMDSEQGNSSILGVRVIAKGDVQVNLCKEQTGTITARIRSLLHDTVGCIIQEDFRERVIMNPAYPLIVAEIGKAYEEGRLDGLFDQIEASGAVIALDKITGKVTLGVNSDKMNFRIKEHTHLHTTRNQRSLDFVNGISPLDLNASTKRKKVEPPVEQSTTYYVTFQL